MLINKFLKLSGFALGMSASVLAQATEISWKQTPNIVKKSALHFYISAQGGMVNNTLGASGNMKVTESGYHNQASSSPDTNALGLMGEAAIGFLVDAGSNAAFGIEGTAAINDAQKTVYSTPAAPATVKTSIPYSYSISALAGTYKFFPNHKTLTYLRLGLSRGLIESDAQSNIGNFAGYDGSLSQWDNGLRVGVGLMSQITRHWSWRTEFDYTQYKGFSKNSTPSIWPNNVQTATWNYKPSQLSFLAGFTYSFS